MKHTPNAVGGEMEGWVHLELKRTLKGQHNKDIAVIVIKGVADYGDLSKGDKWQWTAAKAAMDYIYYCLEKSGGIEFSGEETVITLSRIYLYRVQSREVLGCPPPPPKKKKKKLKACFYLTDCIRINLRGRKITIFS